MQTLLDIDKNARNGVCIHESEQRFKEEEVAVNQDNTESTV